MCGGSEARARVPIRWRRSPARTEPLWSRTGIPSAVSHASLSRPVAPRRRARRNASKVFSGAWAHPPRWAKAIGGSSSGATAMACTVGAADSSGAQVDVDGDVLDDLLLTPAGEGEGEAAPDAEAALTPDAPAVGLDEPVADVEPDPGATVAAGGLAIELEEALEEPRHVAGEDA